METVSETTDIVIIGAGPVGLILGNFLGAQGLRVIILEERAALIDYPRGVQMDDESMRSFQLAGLAEAVAPHTTPNHVLRFVNGRKRPFATFEPKTDEFGWPRRNAFIQPLADQVLKDGLARFPTASLRLGCTVTKFSQHVGHVSVQVRAPDGTENAITASYMVGCDGGRSPTRKALGIEFVGSTDSNRWIVVDLANDPLGHPGAYLHADPARPYVSIALPHGIRRFEFMLFPGEGEGETVPRDILDQMMAKLVPDPKTVDLIRARVYTHNARLAAKFRVGRVLIAGDAAHVMPVWQGQGYNSGMRDATNLAWKLACVVHGICKPELLDSFEAERQEHVSAMIAVSEAMGRILSVRNPALVLARDSFTYVANLVPAVKRYFMEMRWKPMPRYKEGALDYGKRGYAASSWVGRMFIQPRVTTPEGKLVRLDDVLGSEFALLAWGVDPTFWMTPATRDRLAALNTKLICAVPVVQQTYEKDRYTGVMVIGDAQERLKQWFGNQPDGVVILRPDRFVAASFAPQDVNEAVARLAAALHLRE
jgi:3-(3-hydroxy-phenyl)propionate hydroxylase